MTDVLKDLRVDYNQIKKSQKWYADQVRTMGGVSASELSRDKSLKKSGSIVPGQLYYFHYDPKFKDTLPYYDMFPLVFPYKAVPGGFYGLNMHYLGYPERFALFKRLMEINGQKLDEKTKIKFSWATVAGFSGLRGIDACVKHYLNDHVQSPFMKVSPKDWTTAMLMPVEQFVGAKKEYVWSQSKKR